MSFATKTVLGAFALAAPLALAGCDKTTDVNIPVDASKAYCQQVTPTDYLVVSAENKIKITELEAYAEQDGTEKWSAKDSFFATGDVDKKNGTCTVDRKYYSDYHDTTIQHYIYQIK